MSECQCETAGRCPIYNREMGRRRWEICKGISGLSPEKEEFYRRSWLEVAPATTTDKLLNFGKALVGHALAGLPQATETERRRRLEICESCPHHNDGSCEACGCKLAEKVGWADQACPVCESCGRHKSEHETGGCEFKPKWPAVAGKAKTKCCGG